ncbi:MAG TPA: A/G-specific adenine glycosylase [Candidatus Eremiobacteraceae bacterium]|nr:A/G-specific adenine glycosylase [Candidatus Eremiobacteraceae bacterium]
MSRSSANVDPRRVAAIRRAILRWYRAHGRDLAWRRTTDPYAILVSEVMLQQTQVDRVEPRYRAFLRRFPTFRTLADAPLGDVLREWSGLGYNGRAKRLWECARAVVREHRGRMPREIDTLKRMPGIGAYTAGAVATFAFGARAACVDVNVGRVLARSIDGVDRVTSARAWELAESALPRGPSASWTHALMDVGSTFCRAAPRCAECPVRTSCRFVAVGAQRSPRSTTTRKERFSKSRRYFRGLVVKALTRTPSLSCLKLGEQVKAGFKKSDLPWLNELLEGLHRDGLVAIDRRHKTVRLP